MEAARVRGAARGRENQDQERDGGHHGQDRRSQSVDA